MFILLIVVHSSIQDDESGSDDENGDNNDDNNRGILYIYILWRGSGGRAFSKWTQVSFFTNQSSVIPPGGC